MKNLFKTIAFCLLFISTNNIIAQSFDCIIVDSLSNEPIENVYIYNNKKEFLSVSDKNGKCKFVIPDSTLSMHSKYAYISHIGYSAKIIKLTSFLHNRPIKIFLSPTIFKLSEITITSPNANNIIQKAIENIHKNYPSIRGDTLAFDVNFTFLNNPNNKIADFKGKIAVTSEDSYLLAAKYSIEKDLINDSFYDYSNEISPSGFYSIIFIQNHAPIRTAKKVDFHYEGIVSHQGIDVYKISFIRKNKYNNLTGYMLISMNDYAVKYITYEIGEIKKWIAATQKLKGILYTNLESYKVSVSYEKGSNGYKFSQGAINMLFNITKKKAVQSNNTYDVSVQSIESNNVPVNLNYIKIDELFKNK